MRKTAAKQLTPERNFSTRIMIASGSERHFYLATAVAGNGLRLFSSAAISWQRRGGVKHVGR
jgi:hypothetical protein